MSAAREGSSTQLSREGAAEASSFLAGKHCPVQIEYLWSKASVCKYVCFHDMGTKGGCCMEVHYAALGRSRFMAPTGAARPRALSDKATHFLRDLRLEKGEDLYLRAVNLRHQVHLNLSHAQVCQRSMEGFLFLSIPSPSDETAPVRREHRVSRPEPGAPPHRGRIRPFCCHSLPLRGSVSPQTRHCLLT